MRSNWSAVFTWALALTQVALTNSKSSPRRLHRRDTASVSVGDQGTFVGNVVGDQEQYYGIPFAQPPIGANRFKQPQPIGTYTGQGVRDATMPGHVCWQQTLGSNATALDEDCLVLNIIKPASATASSKLPVMVWIYGGGWQVGSSIQKVINGTDLVDASIASNEPIIFVSIQYRVGVFGFIGGKEAAAASKTSDVDLNAGLYDQREALRWINKNIGYFGGDPQRVTAFGQSAGAASVSAQMIADNGNLGGLFSAAIMQSGSAANYARFYPGDVRPQQIYTDLLTSANCADLACLRAMDASALNTAQSTVITRWINAFVPVIDPYFYPLPPSFAFASGKFADIPFITGTTLDEGTFAVSAKTVNTDDDFRNFLALQFGNQTSFGFEQVSAMYSANPADGCPFRTDLFGVPASDPLNGAQYKRATAVVTDLLFLAPKRMQLYGAMQNSNIKSPSWSYLFAQRGAAAKASTGIIHGSDVAYVFAHPPLDSTVPETSDAVVLSSPENAATQFASADDIIATSKMMVAAWLSFANRHDPNTDGVPNWPAYDSKSMSSMQFMGSNTTVIPDTFRKLQTDTFLANPFTYWI
ncbi:unnamed protein product [Tilletia laevis]|uniref:Carboxylesterase type B domain-containing protein n=3 Tax=Tilletia TaxID=13289 RepID=A0A8X7MQW5_9BASI|nr:hypothetical protein CF336_g5610 [Tilletia laevis]KAE8243930.1 hypothetical protein A4X06_0g6052 [Tilletia controversa]KAE8257186.1 hypothetical protein A4X03_0g4755 [Tilletia caries]KAE8205161.1 hypothetical protein CF335_g2402 [Tilletia laevis]CAD6888653.1 unnamed protein product [Tilletia caries]